jgi:uncharacterized protein (DUF736 family)
MKLNFSLFKNTYKQEGSNQPDYTCSVFDKETSKSTKIGGGWVKEGKNGKYISISIDDEFKPAPRDLSGPGTVSSDDF